MTEWKAEINVTQTARTIHIEEIRIQILGTGLQVLVQWTWRDDLGKVLRSGLTRYTEEQLSALLSGQPFGLDSLRCLVCGLAVTEATA